MSVVKCVKIGDGKRKGSFSDLFRRQYTELYRARTDTLTDDPYMVVTQAIAMGLLPPLWTPHESDGSALLKTIEASEQQSNDPVCWILECMYDTQATDPNTQSLDPTQELAQWTTGSEKVMIATQVDLSDPAIPYVNSVGDPFDPPEQRQLDVLVLGYQDNVPIFDIGSIPAFQNRANNVSFLDQDVDKVVCSVFNGRRLFRNNILYWQRNIEFKILPESDTAYQGTGGWTYQRKLDVGYRRLLNGRPVGANLDGTQPAKPVFLNGAGGLLNGTGRLTAGQSPFYATFAVRNPLGADFTELNLQGVPPSLDSVPMG